MGLPEIQENCSVLTYNSFIRVTGVTLRSIGIFASQGRLLINRVSRYRTVITKEDSSAKIQISIKYLIYSVLAIS
jgi:hypothetical protein